MEGKWKRAFFNPLRVCHYRNHRGMADPADHFLAGTGIFFCLVLDSQNCGVACWLSPDIDNCGGPVRSIPVFLAIRPENVRNPEKKKLIFGTGT